MPRENFFRKIVREAVKEEFAPVEDRLLGVEGRLDDLGKTIDDSHRELLRAENFLFKMQDSLIKYEDKMTDSFREFQSMVQGLLDPLMKELLASREEQTILNERSTKINQIGDRVENLEKIHPGGRHATA